MARFGSHIYHHFCSRMHFQANFHIFGLDFATILGNICWPPLLSPVAFWFQFPYFHSWICHSSWEALLNVICISYVFLIKFSYFRSWFCHNSWAASYDVICISYAFLIQIWFARCWFRHHYRKLLPVLVRSIAPFLQETNTSWWLLTTVADCQ